jgi:hypothetical protein
MPLIVFRKSVTYWRTVIKVRRLHLVSPTVTILDIGTIVQKITQ